jgi:ArsR family metal-binding transcriptional regulator
VRDHRDVEAPFVRSLQIVRVIPCLADPAKIRFSSEFDRDVAEIFPYLNASLQGVIYNHAGKTLTLRREGRLISLHPRRMEAAKVAGIEDAQALVAWMVELINDCHRRKLLINPDFNRHDRLTVLDVVKLLPGTNCRRCGLRTCLAFAAALADEKISVMACSDLFLVEFHDKREALVSLLRASGYPVPEVV